MNASRGGRLVFSLLGLAAAVAASQAPVRGQCPSCSSPAAPLTCQGQEYRLVYQTVYEQHQVTAYRIEYETVYQELQETRYRPVWETATRECRYTVARPVIETSLREEHYCVSRPVYETQMRDCSYNVRPLCAGDGPARGALRRQSPGDGNRRAGRVLHGHAAGGRDGLSHRSITRSISR